MSRLVLFLPDIFFLFELFQNDDIPVIDDRKTGTLALQTPIVKGRTANHGFDQTCIPETLLQKENQVVASLQNPVFFLKCQEIA